jgi:4-hydroxybenzoate polyprenyltransferase
MVRSRSKLLAYARLLRLPNVFTAVADPLAGWFVIGGGGDPQWQLPALAGASACLYMSGIVFNDCFDYNIDLVERPERPLPSGEIGRGTAWTLGAVLMVAGLAMAAPVGKVALSVAAFLAGLIFFYNSWARNIPGLRPLALGACRFTNFLLGMRCSPPHLWWFPAVIGAYAAAVTFLSQHEVGNPQRQAAIKRLLLGIIVVDALLVAVSPMGDWIGAGLVLSLLVPAIVLAKLFAMT